jgi:iron(III) transport system permease protein
MAWANIEKANFDAYRAVLGQAEFWNGLWRTGVVASVSATVAVGIAVVAAWVVVRGKRTPATRFLDLFASSSLAIPGSVAALAFLIFYLTTSRWFPVYGTIWVLILAYSFRTSVAYRTTYAGVLQLNRELEEASSVTGASRLMTLRRVVGPLLFPVAGVMWLRMFLLGTHEFTMALFLATEQNMTLPVVLFQRLDRFGAGSPADAAAMAVVYTGFMVALFIVVRVLTVRRGTQAVVSG